MICLWLVLWIVDGMTKFNAKTITLMNSFIADYLQDPSLAVAAGQASCRQTIWLDNIDEEEIYRQLASGEFRLYEEIVLSPEICDTPRTDSFAVV